MANDTSPLAGIQYPQFPADKYVPAAMIAYFVASLPPNVRSKSKDPVPSVKFLLAGRVKNDKGELEVVRKWTNWVTISYSDNSNLTGLFTNISNLQGFLTSDKEGGKLWTTPLQIFLEKSKDGKYLNITKIKDATGEPDCDESVLDLTYDAAFTPYKKVKAFGNLVDLEIAVTKEPDGLKRYEGDQLLDPPEDNSGN